MKKNNQKIIKIAIGVVVVIILAIVTIFLVDNYNNRTINSSFDEIQDYLNINMVTVEARDVDYFIEQKDVAGASYEKEGMKYTLKTSSNPKKNLVETNHNWGANILMFCDVEENKQVQVISSLDEDNLSYMKAEWQDNGMYYGMITDSLTTREDFLHEVNKVVLENHVKEK